MKASAKSTSIKTVKGEQTKALILSTALEMLQERGYEQTTMRAIALKAGVSLGNAYHYFGSKDHLIQAFYHRTHEDHLRASLPVLKRETSLKSRLHTVIRLKIDTLEPYHEFAGVLFQTAAHPHSPLNPFAHAAAPVRPTASSSSMSWSSKQRNASQPICARSCPTCFGFTTWESFSFGFMILRPDARGLTG